VLNFMSSPIHTERCPVFSVQCVLGTSTECACIRATKLAVYNVVHNIHYLFHAPLLFILHVRITDFYEYIVYLPVTKDFSMFLE
jgi:hypothetical protein